MKRNKKQVRCEFNLYPLYEENDVKCIYDKDHMSELWIRNRSERDLCSFEVTVTNRAQKKF